MTESELEARLRQLQPAAPSPQLRRQVEQTLQNSASAAPPLARAARFRRDSEQATALHLLRCFAWSVGGALVLAALIVIFRAAPAGEKAIAAAQPAPALVVPTESTLEPIETVHALVNAEEESSLYHDKEEFARRVRLLFLERHTWSDQASGAVIAVEVPREDILFVPVAMQ